jgi:hypothetical protein
MKIIFKFIIFALMIVIIIVTFYSIKKESFTDNIILVNTNGNTNTLTDNNLLDIIYPIGSIYISSTTTCPLNNTADTGEWTIVSSSIGKNIVGYGASDDSLTGKNYSTESTGGNSNVFQIPNSNYKMSSSDAQSFYLADGSQKGQLLISSSRSQADVGDNNNGYECFNTVSYITNSPTIDLAQPSYFVTIWKRTK